MSSNFSGLDYIICECGVNFNNEQELQSHLQNKHITKGSDDGETDFYILEVEDENDRCNENSNREELQMQNNKSGDVTIKIEPNIEYTENPKVDRLDIAKIIKDLNYKGNFNTEEIHIQNFESKNLKIKLEPNVEFTGGVQIINQQSKFEETNDASMINNIKTEPETLNCVVVNSDVTQSEIVNFDVEFGNEVVLEDNVSYAHDVNDLVIAGMPNIITSENINADLIMFCELCEKVFVGEQTFQEHYERVHTVKPKKKVVTKVWICNVCERNFSSKTSLQNHIYTHTGERPFKCSTCGSSFAVKLRLQIHERIHTDERPFQCERCPKAFRNKAAINRHSRVHTGIKPYACPQCGKTFTQSNSMKLHVRTVHLKEPAPYKSKKRMMRDLLRTREYELKPKRSLYSL